MKVKKITQKLTLNKSTVANLASLEQGAIKGGAQDLPNTVTCGTCFCSGKPDCPD